MNFLEALTSMSVHFSFVLFNADLFALVLVACSNTGANQNFFFEEKLITFDCLSTISSQSPET